MLPYFPIAPPDERMIQILALMLLSFGCGALLFLSTLERFKKEISRSDLYPGNLKKPCKLRRQLFFVLCGVASLIMLIDQLGIIVKLLNGISYAQLVSGEQGQSLVEYSGAVHIALYTFVVWPVTYFVSPVCAVEFFKNNNGRGAVLLVNAIVVALVSLHHGGRASIIIMCISYAVAYAIIGRRAALSRSLKLRLCALAVCSAALVLILSASRGINDLAASFYCYLVACVPVAQSNLAALPDFDGTFGCFSLYGIVFPFLSALKIFGLKAPMLAAATELNEFVDQRFVDIGLGGGANQYSAFMPAGVYPYVDGGFGFEAVVTACYGALCAMAFWRTRRRPDAYALSMYIFLAVGLLLSFTRFWFASIGYGVAYLYIIFLLFKPSPIGKSYSANANGSDNLELQ